MTYTIIMSFFVQPTVAPLPKTKNTRLISFVLAFILVAMAVSQLFAYELFPKVIAQFNLPGGIVFAHLLAGVLVMLEVVAIPFLLAMCLSPAMRIVSMVTSWVAVTAWLLLSLWQNIAINGATNSGILGASLPLPVGWWSVLIYAGLGVLVAWASWGMWPFKSRST